MKACASRLLKQFTRASVKEQFSEGEDLVELIVLIYKLVTDPHYSEVDTIPADVNLIRHITTFMMCSAQQQVLESWRTLQLYCSDYMKFVVVYPSILRIGINKVAKLIGSFSGGDIMELKDSITQKLTSTKIFGTPGVEKRLRDLDLFYYFFDREEVKSLQTRNTSDRDFVFNANLLIDAIPGQDRLFRIKKERDAHNASFSIENDEEYFFTDKDMKLCDEELNKMALQKAEQYPFFWVAVVPQSFFPFWYSIVAERQKADATHKKPGMQSDLDLLYLLQDFEAQRRDRNFRNHQRGIYNVPTYTPNPGVIRAITSSFVLDFSLFLSFYKTSKSRQWLKNRAWFYIFSTESWDEKTKVPAASVVGARVRAVGSVGSFEAKVFIDSNGACTLECIVPKKYDIILQVLLTSVACVLAQMFEQETFTKSSIFWRCDNLRIGAESAEFNTAFQLALLGFHFDKERTRFSDESKLNYKQIKEEMLRKSDIVLLCPIDTFVLFHFSAISGKTDGLTTTFYGRSK